MHGQFLLILSLAGLGAPEPAPAAVEQSIEQLDAEAFDARRAAAASLAALAADRNVAPALAAAIGKKLGKLTTSLETRQELNRLAERLPAELRRAALPAPSASLDEVIAALTGPSGAARVGADHVLQAILRDPAQAGRVAERLKRELADPRWASGQRQSLVELWEAARGSWLATDPGGWQKRAVSDEELDRWITWLGAAPNGVRADAVARESARRELVDLACRDEELARVLRRLADRVASEADDDVKARLVELHGSLRPLMAAEIWEDGRLNAVQYLIVGVPQLAEFAERASHFGPVDEKTAHCLSGNNLRAGEDYPIGRAILNPNRDWGRLDIVFHLVYLPTPRRFLLHQHDLRRPAAERWRQISQRTCETLQTEQRHLTSDDLTLVRRHLDADVAQQFAVSYLRDREDGPVVSGADERDDEPRTAHQHLCRWLALSGTRQAAAVLERSLRDGKIGRESARTRQLGWSALLAILRRDPAAAADEQLAGLVERADSLPTFSDDDVRPVAADVGGTAAALLLERHGQTPQSFHLATSVPEDAQDSLIVVPHGFAQPAGRAAVLKWWRERATSRPQPPQ